MAFRYELIVLKYPKYKDGINIYSAVICEVFGTEIYYSIFYRFA